MAVPKKKTSTSRRNKRRSHLALSRPSLSKCSNCGSHCIPHRACPSCGFYAGEQRNATEE